MKLPRTITIGGKRIRLQFVSGLEVAGAPAHGCYSHESKLIQLDAMLLDNPAALWSTLRHELLEATLFISGHAWAEGLDTEPIVRAIEEIFFPAADKIEHLFK